MIKITPASGVSFTLEDLPTVFYALETAQRELPEDCRECAVLAFRGLLCGECGEIQTFNGRFEALYKALTDKQDATTSKTRDAVEDAYKAWES